MTRGAVLSVVLLSSTVARADDYYPEPLPPDPAPAPTYAPPTYPPTYPPPPHAPLVAPQPYISPADVEDGPKSPMAAGLLSFGATVGVPILAAAMYGDSDGDHNEDEMLTIMTTSALIGPSIGHLYAGKLITPGLGVRAVGYLLTMAAFESSSGEDGLGLAVIGISCIVGGAIHDIATAGRSAREYNFEHAKRTLAPTLAPVTTNGQTAGVQVGLAGNF